MKSEPEVIASYRVLLSTGVADARVTGKILNQTEIDIASILLAEERGNVGTLPYSEAQIIETCKKLGNTTLEVSRPNHHLPCPLLNQWSFEGDRLILVLNDQYQQFASRVLN